MKKSILLSLTTIAITIAVYAQAPVSAKPTAQSEIFADKLLEKKLKQRQLQAPPQRITNDSIRRHSKCSNKKTSLHQPKQKTIGLNGSKQTR